MPNHLGRDSKIPRQVSPAPTAWFRIRSSHSEAAVHHAAEFTRGALTSRSPSSDLRSRRPRSDSVPEGLTHPRGGVPDVRVGRGAASVLRADSVLVATRLRKPQACATGQYGICDERR